MKKLFSLICLLAVLTGCARQAQPVINEFSPTAAVKSTAALTAAPNTVTAPAPTAPPTPRVTPYDVPSDYSGEYVIKVNRLQNTVTVLSKDEKGIYNKAEKVFLCSVGTGPGNNYTPLGIFYTTDKYVWRALYGGSYGQYATRIWGAYLFHSVPYSSKNKATLKSEEFNKLGQAASQGCIRLTVEDAKWIYDNCRKNTCVIIYDSLYIENPVPEKKEIDLLDPRCVWDPTDPDINNPWLK